MTFFFLLIFYENKMTNVRFSVKPLAIPLFERGKKQDSRPQGQGRLKFRRVVCPVTRPESTKSETASDFFYNHALHSLHQMSKRHKRTLVRHRRHVWQSSIARSSHDNSFIITSRHSQLGISSLHFISTCLHFTSLHFISLQLHSHCDALDFRLSLAWAHNFFLNGLHCKKARK